MATLKTIHDTETGEPSRIKYDGQNVYVGFDIETLDGSENGVQRIAVADCLGTYEIHEGEMIAYTSLDEVSRAYSAVRNVPFIDGVDSPFAGTTE